MHTSFVHSLLGDKKLARYLIFAVLILFFILQPALSTWPRCNEAPENYACVANDVDDLRPYMVQVDPTTVNVYLDIHMSNEREKVYVVYDIAKSDGSTAINNGQICVNTDGCPRWTSGVGDGKWSMGNLIGTITNYDSSYTYTLTHILFLWDQLSSCPGYCGSSCADYQQSKCRGNLGDFKIYPPLSISATNYEFCLGGSAVLDITPSGGTPSDPSSGGSYIYSWTPATGLSCTTCQDPTANPTVTTKYTVTVKDSLTLKSVSKDVWVYVHIPPTADFSALPLSGCAPLTVTFTDASSAPSGDIIKKWEWDFTNDGTIDRTDTTAPAPFTHEYTVSGTYSVSLKVTTDKGCTNTKLRTDYIQVNPLPDCTITVPSTPVCEGSTGNAASAPAAPTGKTYSYTWSVTGQGTLKTGQGTESITWDADQGPGSANIAVTVKDTATNCEKSCSQLVTVNAKPDCTITVPSTPVCEGSTGNTASAPAAPTGKTYSYTWSVTGQGTLKTGQGTESITWDADQGPGSANIAVTVKDTATNCEKSCSQLVTVNAKPDCTITVPSTPVCEGSTGNTASAPAAPTGKTYSYTWSVTGQGTLKTGQGTESITWDADQGPGSANIAVTVKDTATNCEKSCSQLVTVNAIPDCTITALPSSVCSSSTNNIASVDDAGTGATYDWQITGGTITSTKPYTRQITWTAGPSGTATLTVIVTTAAGCTVPQCSKDVLILDNPIVFAGPDQNVCDNVIKVSLTGTNSGGPATYLWTTSGTGYFIPDPAVQLSEEYYPSAADKTAGSVTITLTAIGCSAQSVDAMQIYIWEIPIISIVPSAT